MHAHLFCDSKNYVHMCKNQPRRESPKWGTMANFVMSKARRLFSYTDLEGPNNNMAMETTSISIGDSPSPEHSGIILLTCLLF